MVLCWYVTMHIRYRMPLSKLKQTLKKKISTARVFGALLIIQAQAYLTLTKMLTLDYFVDKAKQAVLDRCKMLVFNSRLFFKYQKYSNLLLNS